MMADNAATAGSLAFEVICRRMASASYLWAPWMTTEVHGPDGTFGPASVETRRYVALSYFGAFRSAPSAEKWRYLRRCHVGPCLGDDALGRPRRRPARDA